MGAIGLKGFLGLGGGQSGTGIQGPQGANLNNSVSDDQLRYQYQNTFGAVQNQQALLQALQAQNGLGNQNQVYSQLQNIAQGGGPNPAQQQYQNNINQIAAQQAGAIASQKGISPALQSRLISQQAGQTKQNAAGQGAEALANQQLGATAAAGNMANQQAGNQLMQTNANAQTNLGLQQSMYNSINGLNASSVGMQGNINNSNSQMAGQMLGGQAGLLNGLGGAAVMAAAHGGQVPSAGPSSFAGKHLCNMKSGGKVPGQAAVAGDNSKNDTVPAMLSPKEIVLPRSVTMSKDAPNKAADFVAAILKQKALKKK